MSANPVYGIPRVKKIKRELIPMNAESLPLKSITTHNNKNCEPTRNTRGFPCSGKEYLHQIPQQTAYQNLQQVIEGSCRGLPIKVGDLRSKCLP